MERILIIGCSCSGKSTLARRLGQKLGLPVVHLDQLWWKQGWQETSREEFDEKLDLALSMDRWVIDGNYARTMEKRISRCDAIVYLDFSRWACLWGLCQRLLGSYGKTWPDMAQGCRERFDWEFVKWIWNFNKNNRVLNETYLAKARHAEKVVLKNRKAVRKFLESL